MARPWIGDAIRSSFGYGKADPKYSSRRSTISPVCRAAKASFLPCPLLATNRSGSGRRLTSLGGTGCAWTMSNGPTANASRYVGNGGVTTKRWRTRSRSEIFARDTADGFDFRIPAFDRASRPDQDGVGNAETVAVQPDGARGFAQ